MNLRILAKYISLVSFTIPLVQCDFNYLDPVKLKVITSLEGFDGYYTVDAGDITYFSGSILTNGVSTYEKTFDTMQSLEVHITTRTGATSLTIQTYRNDNKVKEIIQDGLNQSTIVNFSYQYGEEKSTSGTTGGTTGL